MNLDTDYNSILTFSQVYLIPNRINTASMTILGPIGGWRKPLSTSILYLSIFSTAANA
jgi:hypothetical protein